MSGVLYLFKSIMTTKGNSTMLSGASSLCDLSRLSSNNNHSETVESQNMSASWADSSEKNFSANLEDKNVNYDAAKSRERNPLNGDYGNARFFVVKCNEGNFALKSPFLIQKAIHGLIGEPKSIKKLRSGDLLIEVKNSKQAENITKCKFFANIPVSVSAHNFLNSSRGVISEQDLIFVPESEILENLKEQHVSQVRRITIKREDKIIPTKHIILTFDLPNLPNNIKAGYLNCPIRPYIPNPLRCFQCQRFGHSKNSCRGTVTCARCGQKGHENEGCTAPANCIHCQKNHPSYSKSCEIWKLEKEIQTVRTKQNLSYPEARKIVKSRTPNVGITYSAALTGNKKYQTIATQTETIATEVNLLNQKDAPILCSLALNNNSPVKSLAANNNKRKVKDDKLAVKSNNSQKINSCISYNKNSQTIVPPSGKTRHSAGEIYKSSVKSNANNTRKKKSSVKSTMPDKNKTNTKIPKVSITAKTEKEKSYVEPELKIHPSDSDEEAMSATSEVDENCVDTYI